MRREGRDVLVADAGGFSRASRLTGSWISAESPGRAALAPYARHFQRTSDWCQRKNRARRDQAAFFIDFGVVLRPGELVAHLLDFADVLREVSLERGAVLLRQLRRAAHQAIAATHGKTRTEDVLQEAVVRS